MTDNQQNRNHPTDEAGGYGTPTPEEEMPGGEAAEKARAAVPSSEAEMDTSNTEEPDAGRPFSSESGQDAAGLPDGSGTDLPERKSPDGRGDDEERFDAG
ncbi:hypothetical protein [Arthrobacter sp. PM3]|uniref:hypothetical protein n=1 Tax=Arthrobacter sp. PM3 TaxID=2017685 RepID=UPI000E10218D|nr:hypothetical protein [Arthrobacter sp. PM3]AXJ09525.1 hypothetical protein CFN17_07810 [Arthrobacter sp. PM3]